MKKLIILLSTLFIINSCSATSVKLNKEQNTLEFTNSLEVINQKSKKGNDLCCKVFEPLAPYNNVNCMVTVPKKVCVGQPFTIDYAIRVKAPTYLSFWADLMPCQEFMIAQGLQLIESSMPTIGSFEADAESFLGKGGRGIWHFDQGIPAGVYHMSFTYVAHSASFKSFTTLLATNPPSYIELTELEVDEMPLARNNTEVAECIE